MTDRIKQLANNAGYNDQIYEISKQGLDKFAELIIQECIKTVQDKGETYSAYLIEQHFGVEQ